MKFSSDSSPSSASYTSYATTTATNYNDNACPSKTNTPGCINRILRRFLCFNNTIPTHPSDHLKDDPTIDCQPQEDTRCSEGDSEASSGATPGLVARLMGLDSMPMVDCKNFKSVRRTRSMDSLRDVELVQRKHRHVKSTMSFRDAPTFLELENEEFFILSFESGGENKELGSKTRKCDLGFSDIRTKRSENKNGDKNKRRQSVKENNRDNQETNQVLDKKQLQGLVFLHNNSKDPKRVLRPIKNCNDNSNITENLKQQIKKPGSDIRGERGRPRKKKKDQNCSPVKKIETDCDSENTSPVSVLEFSELPIEFEGTSSVHKARLTTSNSKRTLFEELINYNSSPLITSRIVAEQEVKRTSDKCFQIWKKSNKHSQNYAEMWDEGCKCAETDIKLSKWMYRGVLENEEYDEITATFEFEILDQLLEELVDQVFSL